MATVAAASPSFAKRRSQCRGVSIAREGDLKFKFEISALCRYGEDYVCRFSTVSSVKGLGEGFSTLKFKFEIRTLFLYDEESVRRILYSFLC